MSRVSKPFVLRNPDQVQKIAMANILLILIFGSGCCVLTGVLLTGVRLVRLIRRERALANKIRSYWQLREMDPHVTEDAVGEMPESSKIE